MPQKREFVPIASLKFDFSVHGMKETATAKAERVFPLQNRPLPIFKQVFNDADHFGGGEFPCKHGEDIFFPFNRFVGNLMVDRIVMLQFGQAGSVCLVEKLYPKGNELLGRSVAQRNRLILGRILAP